MISTNKRNKVLQGAEFSKDVIRSIPTERALSKEIAESIFTPEFWIALRQSPRLTLQLVRPNGLLKDLGKGFAKGLGVGIPQLIFNSIIDDKEKAIEESNKSLEALLQQQAIENGNIVACKI